MYNVTRVWFGTPGHPANITFFATLGPMSPALPAKATVAAIERARGMGYRISLINATTACGITLTGCSDGCASHPGVIGHRSLADIALPIIKNSLGW